MPRGAKKYRNRTTRIKINPNLIFGFNNDDDRLNPAEKAYTNCMKGLLNINNRMRPPSDDENLIEKYNNFISSNIFFANSVNKMGCGDIEINIDDETTYCISDLNTPHPTVSFNDSESSETVFYNYQFYSNREIGYLYSVSLSTLFDNDIITIRFFYATSTFRNTYLKYAIFKNNINIHNSDNISDNSIFLNRKEYSYLDLAPSGTPQRKHFLLKQANDWMKEEQNKINDAWLKYDEKSLDEASKTEPVSEIVEDTSEPVSDTVEDTSEPVSEIVEDTSEPVSEIVEDTSEPVSDTVEDTSEPVSDTVEDTSEPVSDTVEDTSEPVSNTVEDASEPVSDTVEDTSEYVSSNYEEIRNEMSEFDDMIHAEDDIAELKAKENFERERANITDNIERLALHFGYNPAFFDKLKYFFDKFEDGDNIKEFVSSDGTNYSIRLITADDKIEEIPL